MSRKNERITRAVERRHTGGWSYGHFEHRVRYCKILGKELVGMTGRFHKSWGDFGGFKNQAALNFECLNFLANCAKACIGDQLHPRGRLDKTTYKHIGAAYAQVERIEPLLRGMKGTADIGVISTVATNPDMATSKLPVIDEGFTNMLVELHDQFDVLDLKADFSRYKVVIVPDEIRPVPELVEKLERFRAAGGALLITNESLLAKNKRQFALSGLGVQYLGPAKSKGEYLLPRSSTFPAIPPNPYYLYQHGLSIDAEAGTGRVGHLRPSLLRPLSTMFVLASASLFSACRNARLIPITISDTRSEPKFGLDIFQHHKNPDKS